MVITATTDFQSVLRQTRQSLGLPPQSVALDDDALLAAATRRAAGFICPCPASTLASRLADSFFKLIKVPATDLKQRFRETIEKLLLHGDLLELSSVTSVDEAARNSWIFVAPPSFMMRPGGVALLLGIAPDENSALPAGLAARVKYEGHLRLLEPASADEDLAAILTGLGLNATTEEAWLKPPKAETPAVHLERLERQLHAQKPSGAIPGLSLVDPALPNSNYRQRWVEPKKQSGLFVGRRPQTYGSAIWGYVALESGEPTRFLDLPLKGARFRGCDAAWRLQLAIDFCRGSPQQFGRRQDPAGGWIFDFYGPLPMWVERRFSLSGRPVAPQNSMLSYWIAEREKHAVSMFLIKHAWMSQKQDKK